jgi:SAM-dependent methyltransferase
MDDPREAKRLADKVDAPQWVNTYFAGHLKPDSRVLDVGCGPGVLAAAVARRIPLGNVTGFDASAARLAEARKNFEGLNNTQPEAGEAVALPFADGSFDFVYCRFLLEYLQDKEKAVAEMARVCWPGGTVLLQDLDGQLLWHHPVDIELQTDIERVLSVLGQTGFDPFVGRKLFALARAAGLADIQVQAESYHLFAGKIDEHNLRLWEMKLDIALPAAAKALGGTAAAEGLKARFLNYLQRADTLTYSILFTVTGRKPQTIRGGS